MHILKANVNTVNIVAQKNCGASLTNMSAFDKFSVRFTLTKRVKP